jgi:sigma-B regulation protein RsbU (phosphoserine phosphatase)
MPNPLVQTTKINLLPSLSVNPDFMDSVSCKADPGWIQFKPPWVSAATVVAPVIESFFPKTIPIIIADDDPVSREIISTTVSRWGFRAIVTQDGHEAMVAIRAEQGPVLAILDWMMPEMDGLQVCRRIREAGRLAHIILLTVRGGKESIIEGFRAGADDYLVKPFHADELHARILVGLRVMTLQETLVDRVKALEAAASEIESLKLHIPV